MISPPSYVQVQKNLGNFPKAYDQEQPPSYEIATRKAVYQNKKNQRKKNNFYVIF